MLCRAPTELVGCVCQTAAELYCRCSLSQRHMFEPGALWNPKKCTSSALSARLPFACKVFQKYEGNDSPSRMWELSCLAALLYPVRNARWKTLVTRDQRGSHITDRHQLFESTQILLSRGAWPLCCTSIYHHFNPIGSLFKSLHVLSSFSHFLLPQMFSSFLLFLFTFKLPALPNTFCSFNLEKDKFLEMIPGQNFSVKPV